MLRIPIGLPVPVLGVNVFLLRGANSSILIDSGYPWSGKGILNVLHGQEIGPGDISVILITHGHIDHYGSTSYLKKHIGAQIAVHLLDAETIRRGVSPLHNSRGVVGNLVSTLVREDIPIC